MPAPASAEIAATLAAQRHAFRRFLVARLGNEADADDVLQHSLLKAFQRGDELRDDTRVTAWFYRILRRAVVDHQRSRSSAAAREQAWSTDPTLVDSDREAEHALCRCFEPLIASLKPRHAALLRLVELEGRSVAAAASELALNANTASVALHRARRELRTRLETLCGACANGACLDCDCPPAAG